MIIYKKNKTGGRKMIKGQKKFCYAGTQQKKLKKYSNQCIDYIIIFFNCKVFFEILSLQKYYGYKRKLTK